VNLENESNLHSACSNPTNVVLVIVLLIALGTFFFKTPTPTHESWAMTITGKQSRYRKTAFSFNCQLKKLNANFLNFFRTAGSPDINNIAIFRKTCEEKSRNSFFLPETHQKYSSSIKCAKNHDIRMKKQKI
jgi:hypothetical protein